MHGTSRANAERIKLEGFDTKPGRIGNGAYFWTAVENSAECMGLAFNLAKQWANVANIRRVFLEPNSPMAVVKVALDVDKDHVLNLDEPLLTYMIWSLLTNKLAELLGANWKQENLAKYDEQIHGIMEAFILSVEKRMNCTYKVVFKSQSCKSFSDPLLPYIGNHSCFAVRDVSVLSDMSITHI